MLKNWERDTIVRLFEEAGRIALSIISNPHTELKHDHTLVTAADKAVEAFFALEFDHENEDVYLIGEETSSTKSDGYLNSALKASATWIIDPIDGTALYAHDIPFWGISIGYAQNGVIREGGVFIPALGEMLISNSGKAYYAKCGGTPDQWNFKETLKELQTPAVKLDERGIINLSQGMTKRGYFTCANALQSLCSCVYSGVLLATGRHMAYVMGAKLWDIAGILPSLKALGFRAKLDNGIDLMALEMNADTFNLDFDSERAFALSSQCVCAISQDIIDAVEPMCRRPSVW